MFRRLSHTQNLPPTGQKVATQETTNCRRDRGHIEAGRPPLITAFEAVKTQVRFIMLHLHQRASVLFDQLSSFHCCSASVRSCRTGAISEGAVGGSSLGDNEAPFKKNAINHF